MSKEKEKVKKPPMSLTKKIVLTILAVALAAGLIYLVYYIFHYMLHNGYRKDLSSYEYETGFDYSPIADSSANVKGMDLIAENDNLKLYADPATGYIAVYDKRSGETTYSNPANADDDTVANKTNRNYLKSQLIVQYYNNDVSPSAYDSYSFCVARNQLNVESIQGGVRFLYRIGEMKNTDGSDGISFLIPLEYRLEEDSLLVSIPASGIEEYGMGNIFRIQLLRYMGATSYDDEGYMLVPNGSGSIINFNNGKTNTSYSQYIYNIDPVAANYTTIENLENTYLPIAAFCKKKSSLMMEVTEGATTALYSAYVSGSYCDYNYLYPTFVVRNVDNLRMFGNSTTDIYVLEDNLYDINYSVRYSFLTEDYTEYSGVANYYREKLLAEGVLQKQENNSDIPFVYDVIAGIQKTEHFLGVQYLHTYAMTTFDQAGEMSDELAAAGITNQYMNLQGWFNKGYYHNAPNTMHVLGKLGGKSDLRALDKALAENGGSLFLDVAFQKVTMADNGYNAGAESSKYYGAGYTVAFGQTNPTTLRNTAGLGYNETRYYLLSPKFLSRYVNAFTKRVDRLDVAGISLRDLTDDVHSDKKRTNVISREQALDVVDAQLQTIDGLDTLVMGNATNAYAFAYVDVINNVALAGSTLKITDADVPLYEMVIHGCISYSTSQLNYVDSTKMDETILKMIEFGAVPHYVFTYKDSNEMKETGMNRFYTTTFSTYKDQAVSVYNRVNDVLKHVSGAIIIKHEILENNVRKITYDNGIVIYVNYGEKDSTVDGVTVPAMSYRLEGI